jgi:IS1 family transposase
MAKRVEVVAHLVEGASVRATSRLTGVSKPAILSLLLRVGEGCGRIHDRLVRDVDVREIQMDEIWSYVQKKQRRVQPSDPAEWGDAWTYVALARVSKLVLAYRVGKRDDATTQAFIADMRARLVSVPQLATDGLRAYPPAIAAHFSCGVDYAIIHKDYRKGARPDGDQHDHRYEPPRQPFVTKIPTFGVPDMARASTSHVERQNMTMRMHIRRMTRLCNGFSRKVENHRAATALHFAWYNFVRVHEALRVTPAMEAGITDHVWTVEELVAVALPEPQGEPPQARPLEPRDGSGPARQTTTGRVLRLVPGGKSAPAAPPAPLPAVPPAEARAPERPEPPGPPPSKRRRPEQLRLFED